MTPGAASRPANDVPQPARVIDAVRRGLGLSDATAVSLSEVEEFSNINYVYRAEVPGRTLYIKVVPERGKRFPASLPRERVFSEAEGLRRFRGLAGDTILIPEVLFVDTEEMALGMSDVGEGRLVLFSVLAEHFELLGEQADMLGRALGCIHGGTRGSGTLRPAMEEGMIRKIIFDGLLAPGARQVFPELWESVSTEMQAHKECLIHGDLWTKNLLVRQGERVALVDFEGVCYGDPAFDLGTLIAAALLPALDGPVLVDDALEFSSRLLRAWAAATGSDTWFLEVQPRTFRATGCFLAARCYGPFAYSITERARERAGSLARSLAAAPPQDLEAFSSILIAKH
jgi:tRNA A-37 threonylcarbamoyl transferase component Bud32